MTAQVRQAVAPAPNEARLAQLIEKMAPADRTLIEQAARIAQEQFDARENAMGEGYLQHAIEVGGILAALPMDAESVAAGLLAKLPEVRADAIGYLEASVNPAVARLVEGIGRMAHIQALRGQLDSPAKAAERASQLEALRKMLLAMVQDVRVVLVKLADQTQQMRFIAARGDAHARSLAARDTADLFAPLANRLGVWQLKWELEDLAFRCRDPETYKRIARELDEKRVDREDFIARVTETLGRALRAEGIEAQVTGRPKHIFSIYSKMQRKDLALKDLYDVRGVRILVQDIKDCYTTLGVVHSTWTPLPKEFDDYIAKPKPNNYRSLHTAVVGPDGKVLEVQIRTHEMHRFGELGVAAHWRYKEGGRDVSGKDARYEDKIAWLRQILDWREGLGSVSDLATHFRNELFDDTIYVLTPQGRVVDLPKGATPVDFAYALHTELGHRCRGAKVDGAMVPLSYGLRNGQTVEIIAAKVGGPSRDWLNTELHFVASSRARGKIRQWFNAQNHEAALAQGRQWVEKELQRLGFTALGLDALAQKLEFADVEALFLAAGKGDLQPRAFDAAARALRAPAKPAEVPTPSVTVTARADRTDSGVLIVGVDRLMTVLAACCMPVPPDPIIGFVTRGRGVTVHRRQCENARRLPEERRMQAQWGERNEGRFAARVDVQGIGDATTLRDVLDLLARERIGVRGTRSLERAQHTRHELVVEVTNLESLQRLLSEIERLPTVVSARRR